MPGYVLPELARERTFQKTSQAAGKRLLEVTSEFEERIKARESSADQGGRRFTVVPVPSFNEPLAE